MSTHARLFEFSVTMRPGGNGEEPPNVTISSSAPPHANIDQNSVPRRPTRGSSMAA